MNATLNHAATATVTSNDPLQQWSFQRKKHAHKSATYNYLPQPAGTHSGVAVAAATSSAAHNATSGIGNEVEDENDVRCAKDSYTTKSTPISAPSYSYDHPIDPLDTTDLAVVNFNKTYTLHKSSSYSGGYMLPKEIIPKQDSLNGCIAISLTDDNIAGVDNYRSTTIARDLTFNILTPAAAITNNYDDDDATVELSSDEHDLLMPRSVAAIISGGGVVDSAINDSTATCTTSTARRKTTRGAVKVRNALLSRIILHRKCLIVFAVLLLAAVAFLLFAYFTRGYTERFLFWIEKQNKWTIVAVLMPLLVLVSFPIVVGYFLLMLTTGYLFGALKGVLIIVVGANLGVFVAHWTIRSIRHRIPIHKLIKNGTGRAILRVISGPKAFKVVLFTRLTPIPFGLQNAIFAISAINPRVYHVASFLGLLPAQFINAYLGSTLRSMQEVLSNHGTAVTGYITFGIELICGIGLMLWVIQKARTELTETLLADISTDGKLKEIDV